MHRTVCAIGAAASLACSALAAEVKGTVTVKSPAAPAKSDSAAKPSVVWIDGIKEFEVPKETPTLSQKDAQFTPSFLVVVAGQSVDMPNNDNIAHNVFSFSPAKKFNLGIYPKGESKAVTFDQPGVVELFCSIHRQMNAKILVVPNPCFAKVADDGSFTIAGVPAGTWTLKAWREGHAAPEQQITVAENGATTVEVALTPDQTRTAEAKP